MYQLTQFGLKEMTEGGAAIRRLGGEAANLQAVASKIVHFLYTHLVDEAGHPACALIRAFKTHPTTLLGPALQGALAKKLVPGSLTSCAKCFVLIASAGQEPDWNDHALSKQFQAIPLDGDTFVAQFPMFSQLLTQFGVDLHAFLKPGSNLLVEQEEHRYNVFHVEEAADSPYIPHQRGFVLPYRIQSVVGFGSLLPSGEIFAVILFSRVSIPREVADRFQTLALCSKIALLPFERDFVFS
jgi:hypothetical protein